MDQGLLAIDLRKAGGAYGKEVLIYSISLMSSCVLFGSKGLGFFFLLSLLLLSFMHWNKNGVLCCWWCGSIEFLVVAQLSCLLTEGMLKATGDAVFSIWLVLVVLDHEHRWDRSTLKQRVQTGGVSDYGFSFVYHEAVYWRYRRLVIKVCNVDLFWIGNKMGLAGFYLGYRVALSCSWSPSVLWMQRLFRIFTWKSVRKISSYIGVLTFDHRFRGSK